ncbi:MAG: DNA polymerase domain-containing protein [Armatimonadota bacterium]
MADTQTILFGANQTSGIVAVEALESEVILYIRRSGRSSNARIPFNPWLLVSRREDAPSGEKCTELEGEGYRFKVIFPSWSAFITARNALRANGVDHLAYANPEKQFLLSTGRTLFKGLSFDDVHRLQLDIETTGLSYESESSRIILISVSDNLGYEEVIDGSETDMLKRLVELIQERDPDIIEGHNLFGFDLPFIAARARKCGVHLQFGRDNSEMTFGSERNCPIGGYSKPYIPAHIHGRHIIDTLLAVQRFDIAKGRLERHGLKDCAQALGIAESDRVHIPGEEIAARWEVDPGTVKTYAIQDVRETRSLSSLICPAEFYLTQMVPDTYQNAATSGNGEKINSILIREYLRQGHAIPKAHPSKIVPGGYTELRVSGLIRNIVKCDVESLYPSLMLSKGIKPTKDTLDVFLPALSELTKRRIEAKAKSRQGIESERAYWDGLQNSFKILINSFYGYLGAPFHFNDFDAAEMITTTGQAIVKQIAESIESYGGKVIEIDTDGVYFQAPAGISTEDDEIALVEKIGQVLPAGINLAHDGRYAAMLSLKVKNYVLLDYSGHKIFKGASVRSRSDELFGREFISQVVDFLIKRDREGASRLYNSLVRKIEEGKLSVDQFARRERVTHKTFSSSQKKRMSAVAQGVPIGDYITVYEKNNGEMGLADEYRGDENRAYLLEKLYKFACRLKEGFGSEFNSLFPKPGTSSMRMAEAAGQQRLDLFE